MEKPPVNLSDRFLPLIMILTGILGIFIGRAALAARYDMPFTFHLFDTLTVAGALFVLLKGYAILRRWDWLAALALGILTGAGMLFATLFSPYPFFGLVHSDPGQAIIRGVFVTIAALGGLVILRQGGPVQFHLPNGRMKDAGRGILVGLAAGLPLAVLNVFALQFSQGKPVEWQNPLAALLDALQPGIFEEVVYRFAMWGLLWLILRRSLPGQAAWLAGLLALVVHNYSHFDELFLQAPLVGLGMGTLLALVWGLPTLLLARRRGLESAVAFHWIQDVARFVTGF